MIQLPLLAALFRCEPIQFMSCAGFFATDPAAAHDAWLDPAGVRHVVGRLQQRGYVTAAHPALAWLRAQRFLP